MNLREKLEQIAALKNSIKNKVLEVGVDVLNDDERYINLVLGVQEEFFGPEQPEQSKLDFEIYSAIFVDDYGFGYPQVLNVYGVFPTSSPAVCRVENEYGQYEESTFDNNGGRVAIERLLIQDGDDHDYTFTITHPDYNTYSGIITWNSNSGSGNNPGTDEPGNDNEVSIWFDNEDDAQMFRVLADSLQTKYFDSITYNKQERTLRFVVKEDENHFEEIKLVPADGDGSAGDDAIISSNGRNNTWGYGNGDIATFFINDYGITRIDFYSEDDMILGTITLNSNSGSGDNPGGDQNNPSGINWEIDLVDNTDGSFYVQVVMKDYETEQIFVPDTSGMGYGGYDVEVPTEEESNKLINYFADNMMSIDIQNGTIINAEYYWSNIIQFNRSVGFVQAMPMRNVYPNQDIYRVNGFMFMLRADNGYFQASMAENSNITASITLINPANIDNSNFTVTRVYETQNTQPIYNNNGMSLGDGTLSMIHIQTNVPYMYYNSKQDSNFELIAYNPDTMHTWPDVTEYIDDNGNSMCEFNCCLKNTQPGFHNDAHVKVFYDSKYENPDNYYTLFTICVNNNSVNVYSSADTLDYYNDNYQALEML